MAGGTQRRTFGILMCTGMMVFSAPSFAGFEFTAPRPQVASVTPDTGMVSAPGVPMPIVPMAPVSREPLESFVDDHVLSVPVSHQNEDQVYIRRQREVTHISPADNQAIDTEGLLKATSEMQDISVAPDMPKPAYAGERLVINPYPLQTDRKVDARETDMGTLSVEQAMMEQAGALRPVATPGGSGEIDRARISARYNRDTNYLNRDQVVPRDPASSYNAPPSAMTPIPGGEGIPLSPINQGALSPLPPVAASPRLPARQSPAVMPVASVVQQPYGTEGYTEAVGFGRDLPLALALTQVIPPEYSYAFGRDANAGASVSWQGGKPWDQVLNDMLAPAGMKAVIQNNQVTIQKISA